VAKKGKPIVVGWNNMLPQKHLLTVDETLHWAFMRAGGDPPAWGPHRVVQRTTPDSIK